MQKVLFTGATGCLGRFVVQEFKKRGYWVRVLALRHIVITKLLRWPFQYLQKPKKLQEYPCGWSKWLLK